MSIWSSIGSAIGTALGSFAVSAIERIARVRRTMRPPPPMPWEKGHNWQTMLSEPPVCAWCEQPRTQYNATRPCPGPPPSKR